MGEIENLLVTRWGVPVPCTCPPARPLPSPSPPPTPHRTAHILLNLRGLVFNFINKKFLLLFLFSVADFFSRTKSFIDIDYKKNNFKFQFLELFDALRHNETLGDLSMANTTLSDFAAANLVNYTYLKS
jgi:hypothetical protein